MLSKHREMESIRVAVRVSVQGNGATGLGPVRAPLREHVPLRSVAISKIKMFN